MLTLVSLITRMIYNIYTIYEDKMDDANNYNRFLLLHILGIKCHPDLGDNSNRRHKTTTESDKNINCSRVEFLKGNLQYLVILIIVILAKEFSLENLSV